MRSFFSILRATMWVLRLMVRNMKFVPVIGLTVSCSALRGEDGWTLNTPTGTPSAFISNAVAPSIQLRVSGDLPLAACLKELIRLELVSDYPAGELPGTIFRCSEATRAVDLIRAIELQLSWIWDSDTRSFYQALATHGEDRPDSFGRPTALSRVPLAVRPLLRIHFRFRRYSAGVAASIPLRDLSGLRGSVIGTAFTAIVPDGLETSWASESERTYFEGVRDPGSDTTRQVQTQLKTVSAGLMFRCLSSRLPGNAFRVDGELEVAQFAGNGLDRNLIRFPVALDGRRGEWMTTVLVSSADITAAAAFQNLGIDLAASGDVVGLELMVE